MQDNVKTHDFPAKRAADMQGILNPIPGKNPKELLTSGGFREIIYR